MNKNLDYFVQGPYIVIVSTFSELKDKSDKYALKTFKNFEKICNQYE